MSRLISITFLCQVWNFEIWTLYQAKPDDLTQYIHVTYFIIIQYAIVSPSPYFFLVHNQDTVAILVLHTLWSFGLPT